MQKQFELLEVRVIEGSSYRDFTVICLSETFLDSSISNDDPRLSLEGYSLIGSDHPSDVKQGGVCIYYKDYLPLIAKPTMTQLNEYLVCELKINNKKCFISVLYRSPSQSIEKFDEFKNELEKTIVNINNSNPHIIIFLGDFNR